MELCLGDVHRGRHGIHPASFDLPGDLLSFSLLFFPFHGSFSFPLCLFAFFNRPHRRPYFPIMWGKHVGSTHRPPRLTALLYLSRMVLLWVSFLIISRPLASLFFFDCRIAGPACLHHREGSEIEWRNGGNLVSVGKKNPHRCLSDEDPTGSPRYGPDTGRFMDRHAWKG